MSVNALSARLRPDNILAVAEGNFAQTGEIPVGMSESVNDFISKLSGVLVAGFEGKAPADFYKANITGKPPLDQIVENVSAVAQTIIRKQQPIIQGFQGDRSLPGHEDRVNISRAIIAGIKTTMAEHFVEVYNQTPHG